MRTVYAFRFILHLANKTDVRSYVQLKEIALLENIPIKYLEKIVQIVKRAGLISVRRGSKGGYRLNRPLEDISVKDFFYLLEGEKHLVDSESELDLGLWTRLEGVINNYLEGLSFKDLSEESGIQKMYYI